MSIPTAILKTAFEGETVNNVVEQTRAPLIESAHVNLPATYEAARQAIATCYEMDECKQWEDKAAALAAYAKMRDDDSLRLLALRIQARAADRCGELLKQFPAGDELTRYGIARPCNPVITRSAAAEQAGLSPHEARTAMRVNSVPRDEFERQVESPNPPSVRQLAEQGIVKRTIVRESSEQQAPTGALDSLQALQNFVAYCERTDPEKVGSTVGPCDREQARELVATAERWLSRFVDALPGRDD